MKLTRLCLLSMLTFANVVQADMLKCKVSASVWNYFDSSDKKQAKKCKSSPVTVVTSSGEKIKTVYGNSGTAYSTQKTKARIEPLTAAKDVKPSCGGSGGTVKINGRVFHIDPAAMCKKYGKKNKGSITAGYAPKLFKVDGQFRRKIASHVKKMARKYNMEPEFIHAIISAESAYNPNAQSHAGAQGLMQLMPPTAKRFGVSNPFNPYQNVEAGTRYLKILYDEFGSLELAAAGYNAGEGSVRKYKNSIPPYKETMKYVPKVLAFYKKYKANKSLIATN